MRTLISFVVLAVAGIAQAETPPAVKVAPPADEPKSFAVKSFEPKTLDIATPTLEIKTKEVGGSDLDRKLAKKSAKSAGSDDSMMRAPAMPAIMEEAAAAANTAAAPATAPAAAPAAASASAAKGATHTR